jgi:hypothetical protein
MDLFQLFFNLVVPVFGLSTLLFLWPILAIRSLFSRAFRSVFEENVRGKVVLITGASSGIGEVMTYQSLTGITSIYHFGERIRLIALIGVKIFSFA